MSLAFVLDVGEMVMDIIGTSEGRKLTGRESGGRESGGREPGATNQDTLVGQFRPNKKNSSDLTIGK